MEDKILQEISESIELYFKKYNDEYCFKDIKGHLKSDIISILALKYGTLTAKVHAYEEIISNSNFKSILASENNNSEYVLDKGE